jgi:hypothetical protein
VARYGAAILPIPLDGTDRDAVFADPGSITVDFLTREPGAQLRLGAAGMVFRYADSFWSRRSTGSSRHSAGGCHQPDDGSDIGHGAFPWSGQGGSIRLPESRNFQPAGMRNWR